MTTPTPAQRAERARAAFVAACLLDVAVPKPGNVSHASPGHGMQARHFIDSARGAAGPLFTPGARVGARIEQAVGASWAAAGCNTNLGIVLLCAPIAAAIELDGALRDAAALKDAIGSVLDGLDVDDARAAYRAIDRANPGGLGAAAQQDVHETPTVTLRQAMKLAADRDTIARQYDDGFSAVFDIGLPALRSGFVPVWRAIEGRADPDWSDAVLRIYFAFLGAFPDAHIVRKHGDAVAQNVMRAGQGWAGREGLHDDPALAAWDADLKARAINPGTSADLTVATLLAAGLLDNADAAWHGS